MSQPLHFLERLARVTPAEAALASELARDSVAVRGFLVKARARDPAVPDAERFALPLSAAAQRSQMIVSRDGNAVTCLGPGMEHKDAAALPWAWVDAFARELREAVHATVVLQREVAGQAGGHVLDRLVHAPGSITHADHATLEALVPLLGGLLTESVLMAADLVRTEIPAWAAGRHVDDATLSEWWTRYLRGALAMFLGGARAFPARAVVLHAATPDVYLSARASWWAARRGAETLDVLEELAAQHGLWGGEHELSVAVATEQPLLAGRVRKFVKTHRHQAGAQYLELLQRALDDPRGALDHALWAVLPVLPAVLVPAEAGPGSPLSTEALVETRRGLGAVPGEAPRKVAARMHRRLGQLVDEWMDGDDATRLRHWRRLVRWTPLRFNAFPLGTLLCARAPREAFLPDVTPTRDWDADTGRAYLGTVLRGLARPAAPRPGPNAPCPCGSGKKYKKCHGRA